MSSRLTAPAAETAETAARRPGGPVAATLADNAAEAGRPDGALAGPYRPVLATLAYAVDQERGKVLLIFKDSDRGDTELTKYNGVGGKLEPGENVVAGMRREFTEETGLEAVRHRLRGTVSWPGFGPGGESWFGFIFRVDAWSGELLKRTREGRLEWLDLDRLVNLDLPLWPGDRYFLPLVFDPAVAMFHGVLPYEGGQPVGWDVEVIPA
ncbi:MAG: 8-oxo-dGTP diphosphatase [Propionibacteriaceae bacterium]|jgi:8-oxo-dGTP diphosphatase|nr:8-oxo-dGTP diphosphatase [Propionibacteriaceae bacterium]